MVSQAGALNALSMRYKSQNKQKSKTCVNYGWAKLNKIKQKSKTCGMRGAWSIYGMVVGERLWHIFVYVADLVAFLLNDMKSLMSKWLAGTFRFLTQKTMSLSSYSTMSGRIFSVISLGL